LFFTRFFVACTHCPTVAPQNAFVRHRRDRFGERGLLAKFIRVRYDGFAKLLPGFWVSMKPNR